MRPFVNSIKGQDFFRMQYFAMKEGELVSPNCGKRHFPEYFKTDIVFSFLLLYQIILNKTIQYLC